MKETKEQTDKEKLLGSIGQTAGEMTRSQGNETIERPENPFRGPLPYFEEHKNAFFGRETEKNKLGQSIKLNLLTVLYGKSGMGKSSLLQAGLIPLLKEETYLPVYIRLNFADTRADFEEKTKEIITEQLQARLPKQMSVSLPAKDETLWEYLSRSPIHTKIETVSLEDDGMVKQETSVAPILIFDQFEEIFTLGKTATGIFRDNVVDFLHTLSSLVENYMPESVRLKKDRTSQANARRTGEAAFKILLSFREEYLPQLESLYTFMPSLKYGTGRFRLESMSFESAIRMVKLAAGEYFEPEAIGKSVLIVSGATAEEAVDYKERIGVEPFLLSLFCYETFNKSIKTTSDKILATSIQEGQMKKMLKDFYSSKISKYPPQVKIFVEEKLLTEKGNRLLYPWDNAETLDNIDRAQLLGLVDDKLIRISGRQETPNDLNAHSELSSQTQIELIHDKIAPIIKEERDKRREQENFARKKREKRSKIIGFVVLGLLFAVFFGFFYLLDANSEKNAQLEIRNQEIAKRDAENKRLQDSVKSATSQIGSISQEKAKIDSATKVFDEQAKMYAQTNNKVGEYESLIKKYKSQIMSLNLKVREMEITQKRLMATNEIKINNNAVQSLKDDNDNLLNKIKRLEAENDKLINTNNSLKEELQKLYKSRDNNGQQEQIKR